MDARSLPQAGGIQHHKERPKRKAVYLSAVVLTVNARPATDERYTLSVSNDGSAWMTLASATRSVTSDGNVEFDPIAFDTVTYRYLRIDIDGGDSWVAINEVTLLTID